MTTIKGAMHLVVYASIVLSVVAFMPPSRGWGHGHHRNDKSKKSIVSRNMFSGIVEEMGEVVSLTKNPALTLWDGSVGEGTELVVRSPSGIIVDKTYEGASIAINGVCTTVVVFDDRTFKVGLAPETLRRSNLGDLAAGDPVNLERSLPADGRNSGHFVQGHVDCTGTILSKEFEGESLWVKVAAPKETMRFIVPKGFIAVDGTSLTVCDVNQAEGWFSFMLVQYTQAKIVMAAKPVGAQVNLEADVFGKYAERSLASLMDRVEALEAQVKALATAAAPSS